MAEIRKFGPEIKRPIPYPGHKGLSSAMIQLPVEVRHRLSDEQIKERFEGSFPLFVKQDVAIATLYLEPGGEIAEHDGNRTTTILVIAGSGFMRLGGEEGETFAVQAGDAVLWPAFLKHKAWTENEPMQLITVEYGEEQPQN